MFDTRAPKDYICPICLGIIGTENDDTLIKQSDIAYRDDLVTVIINSFFMGNNPGHAIIVSNSHYENIYDLPVEVGHRIYEVSQRAAIAIKKLHSADGITIRQNNEPAGDQHAFHYHLHVFPRFDNDGFNTIRPDQKRLADPVKRSQYAEKLKETLSSVKF